MVHSQAARKATDTVAKEIWPEMLVAAVVSWMEVEWSTEDKLSRCST